jgi:hypothetical protein
MPTLIHTLPISPTAKPIAFGGVSERLKPFQPVVWVAIAPSTLDSLPQSTRRFPAVLDTGNGFTFCLSEQQFHDWGGYSLTGSARFTTKSIRVNSTLVPCLRFNVWLFPNLPGRSSIGPNPRPIRLPVQPGIAVYRERTPNMPRLPVLGMKTLHLNDLLLRLDAGRLRLSLERPRRLWPWC